LGGSVGNADAEPAQPAFTAEEDRRARGENGF